MTTPHTISASDISAHEIVQRLAERMDELAVHLLGRPNDALSSKAQWRYGKKGSLAIEIDGEKAGTWYDHEHGKGGGALELVTRERGLRNGEALDWARQWLGLPEFRPVTGHADAQVAETPPAAPVAFSPPSPPSPAQVDIPRPVADVDVESVVDPPPVPDPNGKTPSREPTPEERAAKAASIIAGCSVVNGTPAERYLRNRGITGTLPSCLGFRPRAFGKYGALIVVATDDKGAVLAVQQIYITEDGKKAAVEIVKRTNKAVEGWALKAAVRMPGAPPLILAEGVETALSVWQATGQETWACLGISNIAKAPVPEKAPVIVARDGDAPGSKADNQIARAVARLKAGGHEVALASPPEGKDFNDVLRESGEDAIRAPDRKRCHAAGGSNRLQSAQRSHRFGCRDRQTRSGGFARTIRPHRPCRRAILALRKNPLGGDTGSPDAPSRAPL